MLSYGCVIQRYRRWVRRKAATEDDGRGVVAALVVRVLNCRDFIGHEVHTDVEVCAIPAEDHDAIRPDFDGHARAGEVILKFAAGEEVTCGLACTTFSVGAATAVPRGPVPRSTIPAGSMVALFGFRLQHPQTRMGP